MLHELGWKPSKALPVALVHGADEAIVVPPFRSSRRPGRMAPRSLRRRRHREQTRRASESGFSQPLNKVLLGKRPARRRRMRSTPKPSGKSFEDQTRSKRCGGNRSLHGVTSVCFGAMSQGLMTALWRLLG
jgi:hypothetical protein